MHEKAVYRVTLDTSGKDGSAHYEYRMSLQTVSMEKDNKSATYSLGMTKLKAQRGSMDVRNWTLGSGTLAVNETGLPPISIEGEAGVFSTPLSGLYLPRSESDTFAVDDLVMGEGLNVVGTGNWAKEIRGSRACAWKGSLKTSQGEVGTIEVSARFDVKRGSLIEAKGKIVAPDGSITFSLK